MRSIEEIDTSTISEVMDEVVNHLFLKIEDKGPDGFGSSHEIYGTVAEEFGEILDAVRNNNKENLEEELKDIIVAAIWGLASLKQGTTTW